MVCVASIKTTRFAFALRTAGGFISSSITPLPVFSAPTDLASLWYWCCDSPLYLSAAIPSSFLPIGPTLSCPYLLTLYFWYNFAYPNLPYIFVFDDRRLFAPSKTLPG